jgi:hypothetical protein
MVFDSFLCWPRTRAGEKVWQQCPEGVRGLDSESKLTKSRHNRCFLRGAKKHLGSSLCTVKHSISRLQEYYGLPIANFFCFQVGISMKIFCGKLLPSSCVLCVVALLHTTHVLVIPMYICTSQSLFIHSYVVNEWLNRHWNLQIDIRIRADELGIYLWCPQKWTEHFK